MAKEVFNRCEKKYVLQRGQFFALCDRMQMHMVQDAYSQAQGFYPISNIYYDTADDRLIRTSIDKPVYKEKLRLRSYGKPESDDCVFVEIKKKYQGIVNKRRTAMRLRDAYDYLEQDIRPRSCGEMQLNDQILGEIDYFKGFYQLQPKVYLSYDRQAYFDIEDDDFRVTFDRNITARRFDLRLELGSYGQKLLPENVYLMEVKMNGAVPLWFANMISELNIYPVSFSKYGAEYKNYLLENRKGDLRCLNQSLQVQRQRIPSALAHPC